MLADVAAQHNQLGYHHDALDIVRLGEGDERITAAVRVVLHGVKARTYGRLGEADACRRQVDAAEAAFDRASQDEPGWVGRLAHPGRLSAITGHALADLAQHTGQTQHRDEATARLRKAVDELDSTTHARAYALCVLRVGALSTTSGDPNQAQGWTEWIRERLPRGQQIRSGRIEATTTALRVDQDEPAID